MGLDNNNNEELDNKTKQTRYNEQDLEKTSHFKKKFTVLQTIGLLALTLFFSTGGGVALGSVYFWNDEDMKRIDEQLEFYEEKVENDPTNLADRIVLGYTYFLKGKNNEAVSEFTYVIDVDDNYFDAYYNLGLVYLDEEKYQEALSMFNKTVEISPDDYKGHLQMGKSQRYLKLYDEAVESLSEANRLAPANISIIYQIGLVAEDSGDYENASGIFKDALNYDPKFQEALDALDRVEKKLGNAGDKDE